MQTPEDIQKEIDKIDEQIKSEEAKAWVDTDAFEKLKREKEIKQLEKRIAEIDEDIAKRTNQLSITGLTSTWSGGCRKHCTAKLTKKANSKRNSKRKRTKPY